MDVDGVGTKAQPLFSRRIQPDSHSYPKLALALETASLIAEVLRFLVLVTSVYENQSINRQAWHRVGKLAPELGRMTGFENVHVRQLAFRPLHRAVSVCRPLAAWVARKALPRRKAVQVSAAIASSLLETVSASCCLVLTL